MGGQEVGDSGDIYIWGSIKEEAGNSYIHVKAECTSDDSNFARRIGFALMDWVRDYCGALGIGLCTAYHQLAGCVNQ